MITAQFQQYLCSAMLLNLKKPRFWELINILYFYVVIKRLRTCQEYIDHEGITQQSLVINTPKYHKRYILPGNDILLFISFITYKPFMSWIHHLFLRNEDEEILTTFRIHVQLVKPFEEPAALDQNIKGAA